MVNGPLRSRVTVHLTIGATAPCLRSSGHSGRRRGASFLSERHAPRLDWRLPRQRRMVIFRPSNWRQQVPTNHAAIMPRTKGGQMRYAFLIAALAGALTISPASATIRIAGDGGGQIGAYVQRHEAMRQSGERVVIDGPCLSACTMVLGAIPRNRICVTSRALLGFHAAYDLDQSGRQVTSRGGTSLLMNHYPQQVKTWIARRGGLSRQMMVLSGRGLSSMYATCDSSAGQDRAGVSASRAVGGVAPDVTQSAQAHSWRRQNGSKRIGRNAAHKSRRTQHVN